VSTIYAVSTNHLVVARLDGGGTGKAKSQYDRLHPLQRDSHHIHDIPVNHGGHWRISDKCRSDQGDIILLSGMCGSTPQRDRESTAR
jgi:hypothetical protein